MPSSEISLRHRLYFKQAQYMLLIAVALGAAFSMLQITLDYFDTCREAGRTAEEVLDIGKTPALQAAYNFDSALAREVVSGVSKYRMFHHVALSNELKVMLAEERRPVIETRWTWLADRLFQGHREYSVTLERDGHTYGALKAEVDIYLLAESFLKRTRLTLMTGLAQALLLTAVLYLLLRTLITRPLAQLSNRLAQIDASNPEKLRLDILAGHRRDELGYLAEAVNELLESIEEKVAWQARINDELEQRVIERTQELAIASHEISALNQRLKAENLRMGAELEITRRLQEMVLPKAHELSEIEELEIACFMQPAAEVGGDYYDVLRGNNGALKIGIGDVTGHGLESGVLMMMVQTAVRTLLANNVTDSQQFLCILNRVIYENVERMGTDKNLTLSLLDYRQGGQLTLTGQHEEVLVVRANGELERVDTLDLGFIVGLQADISKFIAHREIHLQPGDGIVLYTDGVIEAMNAERELYGIERLCQVVAENWPRTAVEIQDAVIDSVHQHIGAGKPFDDITLVVIKQKEAE